MTSKLYKSTYKSKIAEGTTDYPEGTVLDEGEDEADTQQFTNTSHYSSSGVFLSKRTEYYEEEDEEDEEMEVPQKQTSREPESLSLKPARSVSMKPQTGLEEQELSGKFPSELGLKKQVSSGGIMPGSAVGGDPQKPRPFPANSSPRLDQSAEGGWFKDSTLSEAEQKRLFKLMGGKSKEDFEKLNQKSAAVDYSKLNEDMEARFQKGLQLKRGAFKGLGRV